MPASTRHGVAADHRSSWYRRGHACHPRSIPMPTFFDPERYIPIKEAAELLGINPDHLGRNAGMSWKRCTWQCGRFLLKAGKSSGSSFATITPAWSIALRQIGSPIYPPTARGSRKGAGEAGMRAGAVESPARNRPEMKDWLPGLCENLKARFPDLGLSRSQLQRWDQLYRRPADLLALVDRRGGDRRSQGGPEAWKVFADLFLHESQPSIKQCWQEVGRISKERGWAWCSLKSCHAQIDRRIPKETQIQHREPATYRQQLEPYIQQDPEAWKAGDCWVGDHKQLDMWCMYGEKLVSPWLTAWMDWRTRRAAGWVLSDNPNSSTILAALRHGILDPRNLGGPFAVWIDNGRDYDAWVFHGQTKKGDCDG